MSSVPPSDVECHPRLSSGLSPCDVLSVLLASRVTSPPPTQRAPPVTRLRPPPCGPYRQEYQEKLGVSEQAARLLHMGVRVGPHVYCENTS